MHGRSSCYYTCIPHTTPADHRCTTPQPFICPIIRDPVGMPHSTIIPCRCPSPPCQHTHGHRHTHYRTVSCTTSPSLPHTTSLASAIMYLTRTSSSRPAHVLHSLCTATLTSCPAPFPFRTIPDSHQYHHSASRCIHPVRSRPAPLSLPSVACVYRTGQIIPLRSSSVPRIPTHRMPADARPSQPLSCPCPALTVPSRHCHAPSALPLPAPSCVPSLILYIMPHPITTSTVHTVSWYVVLYVCLDEYMVSIIILFIMALTCRVSIIGTYTHMHTCICMQCSSASFITVCILRPTRPPSLGIRQTHMHDQGQRQMPGICRSST